MILLKLLLVLPALAGNELGNGGDSLAQDFVATGRGMVAELRDNPDPRISDFKAFESAVTGTRVSSAEKLELDGHEVDALNFPHEGRIEVSRPRWASLNAERRRALVLHEYLGICCDRSDRNYEISSSYTTVGGPPEEELRGRHPIDAQIRTGFSSRYMGIDPANRPSFGGSVGVELSRRSTLGVTFDTHHFNWSNPTKIYSSWGPVYDGVEERDTSLFEAGAYYHYWLNEARLFRPYLAAGLGYAQARIIYYGEDTSRKIFGRLGGGLACRLSRSVALDASVNVDGFRTVFSRFAIDKDLSSFFNTMVGLNFYL